jgi:GNAT superfamily N-acetyltransferase
LNWRFVDIPLREYVRLTARSDGEVRAFMVLRLADIRGLDAGLMVDFVIEPSEQGRTAGRALIDAAFAHFRGRHLDLLGSLSLHHTAEHQLLRSKGFRVLPRFLQPQPFPLVVFCNQDDDVCRLASDLRTGS